METLQQSFDGKFNYNIKNIDIKHSGNNKNSRIMINIGQTQYDVVKHVANKNNWIMTGQPLFTMKFDICWMDNHLKPEIFARMGEHQKINHFPNMSILSRKNFLAKNLMLFRKKFPKEYDFFPLTWNLPEQYLELQDYHKNKQQGKAQTFIVKPQSGSQGKGIFLTRNISSLPKDKYVVQRYMHRPYLIDGLKFDLRIYVLITGIDPLRIFVYEEGLARFATQEYRTPKTENLDNKFMHLTNYAINKLNPSFIFNESVKEMDVGHKRSLTSIYQKIKQQGHNIEQLKKRIEDMFIKTIITGYPTISRNYHSTHPYNFHNDMCFQILGFDVILDHELNPFLLEINYTPSFTADSPLDCHIKKNLIEHTFQLLNINEAWKQQMLKKRGQDIDERTISGKRRKYRPEEKKQQMIRTMKQRNEYEQKCLNSQKSQNKYKKIFVLSKQQFQLYQPYYDFAEEIYIKSDNSTQLPKTYNSKDYQNHTYYKHYFDNIECSININLKSSSTNSQRISRQKQNSFEQNKSRRIYISKSQKDFTKTLNSPSLSIVSPKKLKIQERSKLVIEDYLLKPIFKNESVKQALFLKKRPGTSLKIVKDQ